jgi:hypothetical protein
MAFLLVSFRINLSTKYAFHSRRLAVPFNDPNVAALGYTIAAAYAPGSPSLGN